MDKIKKYPSYQPPLYNEYTSSDDDTLKIIQAPLAKVESSIKMQAHKSVSKPRTSCSIF